LSCSPEIALHAELAVGGEAVFRQVRAMCCAAALELGSWVVLLGWLAAVGTVGAVAQTAVDGAVRGVVRDGNGAVVTGASVFVKDLATGLELRGVTGGGGEFVVARVPAGECVVSVEAGGFQRALVGRVAVQVGGVAEVDVQLKVEGVSTSVSVSAEVGLEDASETALASVTADGEIDRLPNNGRRWQGFALLGPVVNKDATGDGLLSFRGLPATQNSTTLDGVSDDRSFSAVPRGAGGDAGNATEDETESGFSSATGQGRAIGVGTGRRVGAVFTFSQEAVREFRVSVQNYSAVYGHGAGGVISTVSKSGANEFHGTGFYLARTSAWGAANPFSIATSYANGVVTTGVVKPNDLRQQFGGSVGGAILRDKLLLLYA
jgi:Carboxypeptidase regulatory-like domain